MILSFLGFGSSAQRQELDLEAALVSNQRAEMFGLDAPTLSRSPRLDHIKSIASRIMHSDFYQWFYVGISVLSVMALITSFFHKCDSTMYLGFEFLLNGALILEISIRIASLQEHFWTSWSNLFDIFVMATCIVTILLMPAECSDAELRLDAVILIIRNVLQAVRLYTVINQGRKHSQIRAMPLDLNFETSGRAGAMLPSKLFAAQRPTR